MSNCLNCQKEISQTAGRRPRLFCDNNNKCKSEYNRKQNKQQKYVHLKSFQELKERFDEVVKERDELIKFKAIQLSKESRAAFEKIKDNAEDLHKNGFMGIVPSLEASGTQIPYSTDGIKVEDILKAHGVENKPITAPKKESAAKDTTTRKRNEAGALEEANKEFEDALGKPDITQLLTLAEYKTLGWQDQVAYKAKRKGKNFKK